MQITSIKAAEDFIWSAGTFSKKAGLHRMKTIFSAQVHDLNTKIIHVAGTNGKGSVCTYISSILRESGYSVGLYTSPHLEKINERIRLNGEMISDEDFINLADKVYKLTQEYKKNFDEECTSFEILTLIALLYFNLKKPDYTVLEVGLGGRLDATNVITPVLSVITEIGLDHTSILGDTLKKIAFEKAGIIKHKVPVISAPQKNEALSEIQKIAEQQQADLTVCKKSDIKINSITLGQLNVDILLNGTQYNLNSRMSGLWQAENILLSVNACEILEKNGADITKDDIINGTKNAFIEGRLEKISENPEIIIDGAHNDDGITELVSTLKTLDKNKKLILIMGVMKDKHITASYDELVKLSSFTIFTQIESKRALDGDKLMNKFEEKNLRYCLNPVSALKQAIKKSYDYENSVILVTGSLYLIGQIRTCVKEIL